MTVQIKVVDLILDVLMLAVRNFEGEKTMKSKILPLILCVIGLCLLFVCFPYPTKENPSFSSVKGNTKTVIRADSYVDLINYAPDHFRDFRKASDQTLLEEDYKALETF